MSQQLGWYGILVCERLKYYLQRSYSVEQSKKVKTVNDADVNRGIKLLLQTTYYAIRHITTRSVANRIVFASSHVTIPAITNHSISVAKRWYESAEKSRQSLREK